MSELIKKPEEQLEKMKEKAIKILNKWKFKIMKQQTRLHKKGIDKAIVLDFLILKNEIERRIKSIEGYNIPNKKIITLD